LSEFRVRAIRGDIEEAEHGVSVAVVEVNRDGSVHGRRNFGREWPSVSLRSAAKPFQAFQVFDGAASRYAITPREIALICSSHNSQHDQVAGVRELLARTGLSESDLVCGPHRSLIKEAGIIVSNPAPDPPLEKPSSLASNCSGKHTGMLAVALAAQYPSTGYHKLGHPVQSGVGRILERMSGIPGSDLTHGVDGCGVVCWAMPLEGLALAYARLCVAGEPQQAIVSAMTSHPDFVAGARRTCTAVMQAFPGEIIAKFGACGVYGAAFPEQRIGLALKIHDGSGPATTAALLAVIDQLQLLPNAMATLPDYAEPRILNTRREVVGKYEAVGELLLR